MKDFYKHNDNVFREKISSHKFDFDPSAWDKMEEMLDERDPRSSVGWRYPYMMMFLGFIFVGLSFLSPVEKDPIQPSSTETNTLANTETTNNIIIEEKDSELEPIVQVPTLLNNSGGEFTAYQKTTVHKPAATSKETFNKPAIEILNSNINENKVLEIKEYIEKIEPPLESKNEIEKLQAFMELNSLLKPVEQNQLDLASIPLGLETILLKEKKVKMGVQAGASVVLTKRSIADQGKLATAIGGFINVDIDSKNSVALEVNYKNGYSEKLALIRSQERSDLHMTTVGSNLAEADYVSEHGFAEVNNVSSVKAVEVPVIYKRKIGKRNSLIAGVKTSIMKFKSKDELQDDVAETFSIESLQKSTLVDVGLVAGIEHKLSKHLSVDLRYNQGLKNISTFESVKNHNSDLAVTVKYTF